MNEKITGTFLSLVRELEPVEFIGLAKLLGVSIIAEKGQERDFFLILKDIVVKFEGLKRGKRRELIKILQKAKKEALAEKKEGGTENGKVSPEEVREM